IERVREGLLRVRRVLLEDVVHTQLDHAVPRHRVAELHVVVGGRRQAVARGRTGGDATVLVRAQAFTRVCALLDQAGHVTGHPARAEVAVGPVQRSVGTQAPGRVPLLVQADVV